MYLVHVGTDSPQWCTGFVYKPDFCSWQNHKVYNMQICTHHTFYSVEFYGNPALDVWMGNFLKINLKGHVSSTLTQQQASKPSATAIWNFTHWQVLWSCPTNAHSVESHLVHDPCIRQQRHDKTTRHGLTESGHDTDWRFDPQPRLKRPVWCANALFGKNWRQQE